MLYLSAMDTHAFIADIETWGTGGHLLDLLTLKDGSVLMIADGTVVLYPSRGDFERGVGGRALQLSAQGAAPEALAAEARPHLRAVS